MKLTSCKKPYPTVTGTLSESVEQLHKWAVLLMDSGRMGTQWCTEACSNRRSTDADARNQTASTQ